MYQEKVIKRKIVNMQMRPVVLGRMRMSQGYVPLLFCRLLSLFLNQMSKKLINNSYILRIEKP